jgi:alkaline phosphatase
MQKLSLILIVIILSSVSCQNSSPKQNKYENHENENISFTNPSPYDIISVQQPTGKAVKNVILMIGDGMGLTQVSTAWVANRGKLNLDNFPYTGVMRTYTANKLITDSGAAGTAMATGQKTNYHSVGVDIHGNDIPSLIDLSAEKGLSTAVVVTCGLTDATPATFLAGNADRNNEEELALDFLQTQANYILGGSRTKFNKREDERDLLAEMAQRGYKVTSTWEETKSLQEEKIFAVLEDGQLPLAPERGTIWQEAVMHAISQLDKNDNGFFAMFEGSRIDDCGHWHDIPALMGEIFDFDQTIGQVLQWAEKDGETLVIVLADHETGGLTLLDGQIDAGSVVANFSTDGHSDIQVLVYAYGPGAEAFSGTFENTAIFNKISSLLNLK